MYRKVDEPSAFVKAGWRKGSSWKNPILGHLPAKNFAGKIFPQQNSCRPDSHKDRGLTPQRGTCSEFGVTAKSETEEKIPIYSEWRVDEATMDDEQKAAAVERMSCCGHAQ